MYIMLHHKLHDACHRPSSNIYSGLGVVDIPIAMITICNVVCMRE